MVPRINNYNNNDNNQSNHIINPNMSRHNRIINDINYINNINNSNNDNSNTLSQTQIQLNMMAERTNNIFIVLFISNKCVTLILLLSNIVICGLGTILIGIINCRLYDFLLGIIQCLGFFIFSLKAIDFKKNYYLYKLKMNYFFYIYLMFLSIAFYISSIYTGIFHNFIFFNPKRTKITENKEKGVCIIILNLITGGLGTLLYGFLVNKEDCFNRLKIWIVGIVQISSFSILIFSFSSLGKLNKMILIVFFFIGAMGYLTSILIGIRCYKKISGS